jgi:hypothetical protein
MRFALFGLLADMFYEPLIGWNTFAGIEAHVETEPLEIYILPLFLLIRDRGSAPFLELLCNRKRPWNESYLLRRQLG